MMTIGDFAEKSLSKLKEYKDPRSEGAFKNIYIQICKQNNLDSTDANLFAQVVNEMKQQLTGLKPEQLTQEFAKALAETGDAKTASLKAEQSTNANAQAQASAQVAQASATLAQNIVNFLQTTKADMSNASIKWIYDIANGIIASKGAFDADSLSKICSFLDADWQANESVKNINIIQPAVKLIQTLGGTVPTLQSLNRPQQATPSYPVSQ